MSKFLSFILLTFISISSYASAEKTLTTNSVPSWESETHCMTIAKMARLPEHKSRIEMPEGNSIESFSYQLGFAEGFIKAMSISTGGETVTAAKFVYQKQCS